MDQLLLQEMPPRIGETIMSADTGQAQAVANALQEDKSFRTVQFAVTGQPDADSISGIMAVLREFPHLNARARHRVLEYLAHRYADQAQAEELWAKSSPAYPPQSYGPITGPSILPQSVAPPIGVYSSSCSDEELQKTFQALNREAMKSLGEFKP